MNVRTKIRPGFVPMHLASCALLALLCASPAGAAPTGEDSVRDQLKAKEAELRDAKQHEEEISAKAAAVSRELGGLQEELVALAAKVQANEKSLTETEDRLASLTREFNEKTALLTRRRSQLVSMVAAAVRLSQTPPEAAIMMPGDFQETMTAARVLSTLQKTIQEETAAVAEQLAELKQLKAQVEDTRSTIADEQKTLKSKLKQLDSAVAARKTLSRKLNAEQAELKKNVADLAREAKDLQDLISSLERQREQPSEQDKKSPEKKKKSATAKLRSFVEAKGKIRLPATGKVKYRYGQRLDRNETSKGVTLVVRSRARVVAPFDGEVVFSGPFMNYGSIVILRHGDDYHTLLAGFDTIDVSVGDFLLEGEPIGAMGNDPKGEDFYLELRKNNQPIDPMPWFASSKSR